MGKATLITGAGGFVGPYLTDLFFREGREPICQVRDPERFREHFARLVGRPLPASVPVVAANLRDPASLERLFAAHDFSEIVHLAGKSFVPVCWENPGEALEVNALGSARLLQKAREAGWRGKFLLVSTGQIYGAPPRSELPLTEQSPLAPDNPYSSSKLTAETFASYYQSDDLRVIIARPFNHIGPGQNEAFVVPAFLKRIREARDNDSNRIIVGDLESSRDFTDVRDVVAAYRLLLDSVDGGVYNVCSGETATIGEVLEIALATVGVELKIEQDPALLRPEGPTVHFGAAGPLGALGWAPKITLRQSIEDAYKLMENRGGIPV